MNDKNYNSEKPRNGWCKRHTRNDMQKPSEDLHPKMIDQTSQRKMLLDPIGCIQNTEEELL